MQAAQHVLRAIQYATESFGVLKLGASLIPNPTRECRAPSVRSGAYQDTGS